MKINEPDPDIFLWKNHTFCCLESHFLNRNTNPHEFTRYLQVMVG